LVVSLCSNGQGVTIYALLAFNFWNNYSNIETVNPRSPYIVDGTTHTDQSPSGHMEARPRSHTDARSKSYAGPDLRSHSGIDIIVPPVPGKNLNTFKIWLSCPVI